MTPLPRDIPQDTPPDDRPLWIPTPERIAQARLTAFVDDLHEQGYEFDDYEALWQWSVDDLDAFWGAVWELSLIHI